MDSTSPLLAFSYSYGGCEISDPECPIEEVEEGGVPLRDGVPSRYSLNGARRTSPCRSSRSHGADQCTTWPAGLRAPCARRLAARVGSIVQPWLPLSCPDLRGHSAERRPGSGGRGNPAAQRQRGREVVQCARQLCRLRAPTGSGAGGRSRSCQHVKHAEGGAGQYRQWCGSADPQWRESCADEAPWTHGAASGSTLPVPFSARYLRTTGTLRTGSIRGEATLLADYY